MRLRVATLNVWALPWGIARHLPQRISAIGAALADLDADVVALQEVWTEDARRLLIEAGSRAGLVHRWHNRGTLGASGLLVLSRLAIVEARFDSYRLRGRPERVWHGDYWGGKGFALLGLQTPQGPLAFVDTHLHAQYADEVGDEYHGYLMGQVVQLASALAGVSVPLVAAGDFNLHPDQPHYPALVGLAQLRDAAAERADPQPTTLRSNPYRGDLPDARIDYVFVRDGGGLLALPVGCGLGALTEWPGAQEARAFDATLGLLDRFEQQRGSRQRRGGPHRRSSSRASLAQARSSFRARVRAPATSIP